MASHHFPDNSGTRLCGRFRFAREPQTVDHHFEIGIGEMDDRAKQNSITGFFDLEFRARPQTRDSRMPSGRIIWPLVESRVVSIGKTPIRLCHIARCRHALRHCYHRPSALMNLPRLYPILDTESLVQRGVTMETAAAAFLEGGAGVLQIRHKLHWSREVFAAAKQVARLCRQAGVALIVNDRADFAMLLEAGLHLGQDDLAPGDARKLLGPGAVIGFSSHNVDQLSAAGSEPVDYVAFGPVFSTTSKRNPDPVVGVEQIRRCRALVEKPLVAIGGITLENALDVLGSGADSVAVIAGLLPQAPTARSLRERMEQWQLLLKIKIV